MVFRCSNWLSSPICREETRLPLWPNGASGDPLLLPVDPNAPLRLFLSRSPPVRIYPLKTTTPLTDYVIDLAPAHRVLRLTVGKALTDAILAEMYTTMAQVASQGGPYSSIFDCSAVVESTITAPTMRRLAGESPAVPTGTLRVVVAPAMTGMHTEHRLIARVRAVEYAGAVLAVSALAFFGERRKHFGRVGLCKLVDHHAVCDRRFHCEVEDGVW
jgi:hypothetical protein